jgi:arginyl-tRNA synthetase
VEPLQLPEEIELIRRMAQFNDVLEESLRELEPHRMVFFLLDLAGEFHRYYNRTRILSENRDLTGARMLLAHMVQLTIRRGLNLLGIDAPMKMISRSDVER